MPDYHANIGPAVGPIRDADIQHAIGVQDAPGYRMPVGMAFRAGRTADGLAVFKLTVQKVILPDRYICIDREFHRLGDAAEVIAG
jgi:hypothetical protein